MTQDTKNKFAEILAKAQGTKNIEPVKYKCANIQKSVPEIKKEFHLPEIELSKITFNDIIAPDEIKPNFKIVDYSEKAFAIVGDTKPIKEKLKQLGGSFNPRLACGIGWIFSKKRYDIVKKELQLS